MLQLALQLQLAQHLLLVRQNYEIPKLHLNQVNKNDETPQKEEANITELTKKKKSK